MKKKKDGLYKLLNNKKFYKIMIKFILKEI